MKNLIIGVLSLLVLTVSVNAQDAKKAVKEASKALKPFMKSPGENADVAKAALATMEENFGTPEKGEHYVKKGNLYLEVTEAEEKVKLLNPTYEVGIPNAPVSAMEAFNAALTIGDKNKDALKGIDASMTSINNLGVAAFELKDYKNSFNYYDMVTKCHETLESNETKSMLSDPALMSQHKFYTAVAGYYGEMNEEIKPYLMDLHAEKYDHSFVYEALFNISKDDPESAFQFLKEGRERYPEEKGLLYAEINYFLGIGNLEEPIDRIKEAIQADPENVSLYTTLGNVYDQLYQKELEEGGDPVKGTEYFNEAYASFNKTLEIDNANFDATYSIGALYYNKAASLTTEINELANDYSSAGTKKYDERKSEMDGYFNEALPYFENAHNLNASDVNTIIALKEIYARKNMFDKVNEMKEKLDAING